MNRSLTYLTLAAMIVTATAPVQAGNAFSILGRGFSRLGSRMAHNVSNSWKGYTAAALITGGLGTAAWYFSKKESALRKDFNTKSPEAAISNARYLALLIEIKNGVNTQLKIALYPDTPREFKTAIKAYNSAHVRAAEGDDEHASADYASLSQLLLNAIEPKLKELQQQESTLAQASAKTAGFTLSAGMLGYSILCFLMS